MPKHTANRRNGSGGSERRPPEKGSRARGENRNVGAALRSVYQETVNEDVPSEMLDLLGKLG